MELRTVPRSMLVDTVRYVWPALLQVLPNGRMAMPVFCWRKVRRRAPRHARGLEPACGELVESVETAATLRQLHGPTERVRPPSQRCVGPCLPPRCHHRTSIRSANANKPSTRRAISCCSARGGGGGAACLWFPALDALDLPVKVGDILRILPLAMDHVFSFGFQLRLQGAHVALVLEVASRLTSTESTRQDGEFATLGARSLGQAAFAPPGQRTHQP